MRPPPLAALAALLLAAPAWGLAGEEGPAPAPPAGDLAAPPGPAAAPRPRLTLDLPVTAATTGGLLLLAGLGALEEARLTPPSCRWCEPGQLDRWARAELRWGDPARAAALSDGLQVAVPAGAALALGLMARQAGAGWGEVGEDLLVVTEAVALSSVLTQAAKVGTARLRPYAWAEGGSPALAARLSFWSGHTSLTFSVAAAATQVARLRGRAGWRWLGLATFAGAAATGWLRVAGDRHWLTDVLAGAAVGTAAGLGVPLLVLHPAGERSPAVALLPAPGGLALVF